MIRKAKCGHFVDHEHYTVALLRGHVKFCCHNDAAHWVDSKMECERRLSLNLYRKSWSRSVAAVR